MTQEVMGVMKEKIISISSSMKKINEQKLAHHQRKLKQKLQTDITNTNPSPKQEIRKLLGEINVVYKQEVQK